MGKTVSQLEAPFSDASSAALRDLEDIEITSWLVSAYDFYSRVVKSRKRTSERSERVSLATFHNE